MMYTQTQGNMTSMTKNPYQQASSAYKQADKENLNGFQITAKLYEGIVKNLHDAKRCYQSNDLEEMVKINANTFDILAALQSTLDKDNEEAQDYSDYLYRFYNIAFIKLAEVLEKDDPAAEYDDLINFVRPLYQQWQVFATESVNNKALGGSEDQPDHSQIEPVDITE
tara:strand:+ start:67 stop:570 length:504 start_codon:yes stop_codon:yes gene_type:complete